MHKGRLTTAAALVLGLVALAVLTSYFLLKSPQQTAEARTENRVGQRYPAACRSRGRCGGGQGFQGNTFEKLLGPKRHLWMKSLGNKYIETRSGPTIQTAEPAAAQELLDLALADRDQRLLFFCSCPLPRQEGKTACHRDMVAGLVLKAAKNAGVEVEVIEWPGGGPGQAEIDVPPATFKALERGRVTIPLDKSDSPRLRCLSWGSIVTVRAGEREMRVVTGPASWQDGQWLPPVFWYFFDPDTDLSEIEREAAKLRRSWGLDAR